MRLHVLIVEDRELDAELLIRALERGGYEPTHERVETADAMRAALQRKAWDVVLADYQLPQFSAPAAFALIKDMGLDLPFIIISGTIGEEAAAEALRAGVHDFIIKDKPARLVPAIEREVREAALRRDRLAERARAEAEREHLIRELRDAVQARDAFLAIASHELKTPLTSLMLLMQGLSRRKRRTQLPTMSIEKLEAKLETIARQVNRLDALVRNLLDVGRITSARMKLSREDVDLGDLVANVVAQSDELIRRSKSNLAVHVSSAVGSWDRLRLETVIGNLLENAVKFGDAKPIDVAVSTDDGVARLMVIDQGIGISAEAQARIFEKFERAVPEQHYGGFGLGLWIVRQIVEAHDGTVRVTSEAGRGSTFIVELPVGGRANSVAH